MVTARLIIRTCLLAILAIGVSAVTAKADPVSGTLYFTTFNDSGPTLHKVDFGYNGVAFTLSPKTDFPVTNGHGWDGVLFLPDGNLVVGSRDLASGSSDPKFDNMLELTPAGVLVSSVKAGTGAFHNGLSSDGKILYNVWNNTGFGVTSPLSAVTLSATGGLATNGVPYTVTCAAGFTCTSAGFAPDLRGVVFDPSNSTWYYGAAPGDGLSGDFGTVAFNDTTHTAVLTPLLTNQPAHSVSYDPFTQSIIMSQGNKISQFKPGLGIVSTYTNPVLDGNGHLQEFDQVMEDGLGHLFAASNGGQLLFMDYGASGLVGSAANFKAIPFLAGSLDSIALVPASGSVVVTAEVPEPTSVALLGIGLLGFAFKRSRNKRVASPARS